MSKLFSEYLNEMARPFRYQTKEEIRLAIQRFDELPKAKQPSEAKSILKAAEKLGYMVKAEKILKYADKKESNTEKDEKKETKNNKFDDFFNNTVFDNSDKHPSFNNSKEESKYIKKHLSERFPFAKFSVKSDYDLIRVNLVQSPFEKDSKYNKYIIDYVNKFTKNIDSNTRYNFNQISYDFKQSDKNSELEQKFDKMEKEAEIKQREKEKKDYEDFLKKREEEDKEYREYEKARKEMAENIEKNVKIKKVDSEYVIPNVKFAKLNKNDTIEEYEEEILKGEYRDENVKVDSVIHFNNKKDFDNFSNMLLNPFTFLKGKGGNYEDGSRSVLLVMLNGEKKFVVDPQGYNYARYVGIF